MHEEERKLGDAPPERAEPELLYHYTTQRGLLGILREQCIWASHINHLNDASEFKHGIEVVSESLSKIVIDPSTLKFGGTKSKRTFQVEKYQRMMRAAAIESLKLLNFIEVFVASFFDSEGARNDPGDVLEQWRAYSGSGAGISIGFDKKLLSEHVVRIDTDPDSWMCYGTCHYRKDDQDSCLAKRVDRMGPEFVDFVNEVVIDMNVKTFSKLSERFKSGLVEISYDDFCRDFRLSMDESEEYLKKQAEAFEAKVGSILNELVHLTVFMKHPSFEQENEWRLASFLFENYKVVKFREGTSGLIPYVSIPLPLTSPDCGLIRRIVVGPSPKLADAVGAVKMLIRSYGLTLKSQTQPLGIDVVPSNIPYRSW